MTANTVPAPRAEAAARRSKPSLRVLLYVAVYLLTALWLVPVLIALVTSFRTNKIGRAHV